MVADRRRGIPSDDWLFRFQRDGTVKGLGFHPQNWEVRADEPRDAMAPWRIWRSSVLSPVDLHPQRSEHDDRLSPVETR